MAVKIRPARNGKGYEYDIRFRRPDGTQVRERANAPLTGRSAALRWAEARERELFAPPPKPAGVTLAALWPRVLADHYLANRKKPSTVDAAKTIARLHLLPKLGSRALETIGAADVAAIKGALAGGSPKTVNNVLAVLSRVLRCAHEWGLIAAMPRVPMLPKVTPEMDWYEVPTYRRLVAGARAAGAEPHVLVLLGGSAGLRRGEIRALRWCDVDFDRAQLRIGKAVWHWEVGTPKGNRHRIVPMTEELARALHAHRHLKGERVLYADGGRKEGISNGVVHDWMCKAQRRAGLEVNGRVHVLRHTFCSHLAAAGVPAKAIQELAGHADLSTTLRYMHLSPGDRDGAMVALGAYQSVAPSGDAKGLYVQRARAV